MSHKYENLGKHGRTSADAYPDLQGDPIVGSQFAANDEYNRYSRSGMGQSGGHYHAGKTGKRKVGRIVLIVVIALVVLLAVFAFCLVNSARALKSDAQVALQNVSTIQESITNGQYDAAASSAETLAATASSMKSEMDSPLWSAAAFIPVAGSDISGVKTLVNVLNDASRNVLVPLTTSLQASPSEGLISESGAVDVNSLTTIMNAVQSTAPAMDSCAKQLEGMSEMNISQLKDMVDPAKEKVVSLNNAYQQAAAFAPIIGDVLGGNGERSYLVVAQNSTEIRASGGFPGSAGLLNVENGKLSMGDFASANDSFTRGRSDSVPATETEEALFGAAYMNRTTDVGFDPNFELVAKVWAAGYEDKNGTSIDGVISITPSMVQDILAITGPIALADGTQLDGSNATKVLQHDLYWKYMSTANRQVGNEKIIDALFADAASQAFDKLLGNINPSTLSKFASVMVEGSKTREFMFYLTNADEQASIESLNISGALNSDPKKPEIGAFMSIWIPSKMGWYVDADTQIAEGKKNSDGTTTYHVTTTYANTITANEAAEGGAYIVSEHRDWYEKGDMQPFITFFAPAGGSISNLSASNTSSGASVEFTEGEYEGLQVFYIAPKGDSGQYSDTPLLAGQSIVCSYDVTVSAEAEEGLKVSKVPTLTQYR